MWEVNEGVSKQVAIEAGISLIGKPSFLEDNTQLQLVGEKEGVR